MRNDSIILHIIHFCYLVLKMHSRFFIKKIYLLALHSIFFFKKLNFFFVVYLFYVQIHTYSTVFRMCILHL